MMVRHRFDFVAIPNRTMIEMVLHLTCVDHRYIYMTQYHDQKNVEMATKMAPIVHHNSGDFLIELFHLHAPEKS
jgi:hypothetical protein